MIAAAISSRVSFRLIQLRRPPVISLVDREPFVPSMPGVLDEVDRIWQELKRSNPAYFDGRIYHVLNVHRNGCGGAILYVKECAYRFRAVQSSTLDVGTRSLGVKGITVRDRHVLMGRRSERVARYNGQWEFAPGGVLDAGADPARMISVELQEETGLLPNAEPVAVALLYDDTLRCWEIIYRIDGKRATPTPSGEYSELRWCDPSNLPAPLSPIAIHMSPLAGVI